MNFFIKTSSNLYIYWNFGSLIILMMSIQIILGLMLSMYYFSFSNNLFFNSINILFNLNYGWMLRFFHSNMTSMIFIMIYFHMIRSLIYKNYINKYMWNSGLLMIILLMLISFLGYSLIMSQMAYWASMVITNFLSMIPIIGKNFLLLIWGEQFISNILINRFFSIHYFSALILMLMSMIHLIILHKKKSSNPLNLNNNMDQINLNSLLIFKDLTLFILLLYMFLFINMIFPIFMNNYDNFNQMMIFKTPNHIEPEWYFLFFYSILRSNKNKLNGLMIMFVSILIWFFLPLFNNMKIMSNKYFLLNKLILKIFILMIILITWIGMKPSKQPYLKIIKILIIYYFMIYYLMYLISNLFNKLN